jgi:hypothetical protein
LLLLPRAALLAENLFLRKQLAMFTERKVQTALGFADHTLHVDHASVSSIGGKPWSS